MFSTSIFDPIRRWIAEFRSSIFRLYAYLMLPTYKHFFKRSFALADIKFNGERPWDMKIKSDKFYMRMAHAVIGFDRRAYGETYMDGDWECDRLDQCTERI